MDTTVVLVFLKKRDYIGLLSPFNPPRIFPELTFLSPDMGIDAHNEIYEGVRRTLFALGLDSHHYGTSVWNPLGKLAPEGGTIVIKPNLVRHYNGNPEGSLDSVVTHGSVLRPLVDYAYKAVGSKGRVIIADAPQHDCDIEEIKAYLGIKRLKGFYKRAVNFNLEFHNLQQEFVIFKDGIVVERVPLEGDPDGYSIVDLHGYSVFNDDQIELNLLRGADYDEQETINHHTNGINQYLISNTILKADLIINVPKVKTHKKAGVTLALKNLVGINGNKNYLPHYRAGFPSDGGDEYPDRTLYRKLRSIALEQSRRLLKQGKYTTLLRFARKIEKQTSGKQFIRAGNYYGNDTIWRTIVDLNKILFFADKDGVISVEQYTQRKYLAIFDGIVAGDGDGPMECNDKPVGFICGTLDPVAADVCLTKLMGFNWQRIPTIINSIHTTELRYTDFTNESDTPVIIYKDNPKEEHTAMSTLGINLKFKPHFGWVGHVELHA